jgi:hypothetical protein
MLCAHKLSPLVPTSWHVPTEQPVHIPARDSEPEPDVALTHGQITDYLQQHPEPADLALVTEVADSSVDEDRGAPARRPPRFRDLEPDSRGNDIGRSVLAIGLILV